ncbi:Zn-dependent exopeptidase M28 [Candidatus Thorarchaeota archaeon]|nr:MAG: Zn-dependent exopeptidase M28 [Candidatus Thorarchaeota archaeon]
MKRFEVLVVVTISLLVISSLIPTFTNQTNLTIQQNVITKNSETQIERVYGVDKSQEIFNYISKASFTNYVRKLTENGSRWIQAPELASNRNTEAREWIADELASVSNGRIEVEFIGNYKSVVGRLPGYLPIKAPVFLVGGHYDSVLGSPGANDDGTGVATMLEIARVMSRYEWPLDIYFGAWNAEEIGLYGSKEVAQQFVQRDIDILVHYNVDMLLVPDPFDLSVLMVYQAGPYHIGRYWADLPSMMSKNYGQDIIQPVSSTDFPAWQRSDHYSFIEYGYGSSLFAHESGAEYDIWYHSSGDSWDNPAYDYEIATQAVRAIGASIAFTMSRAYGEVVNRQKTFDLIPGHVKDFNMVITGPTIVNVSCRWYSGGATFSFYNAEGNLIDSFISDNASPWESQRIFQIPVSNEGLYLLRVFNHRGTTAGYELSYEYDTDIDNNDVPDSQEFWIDKAYFMIDTDLDTISDAEEMIIGTSWESVDTDSDLMPDNYEIDNQLNPLDPSDALQDLDGDSLTNLQEYQFGSSPLLVDTDSDALPDPWEYQYGLNPLVDDSLEDPDNDGFTNIEEYQRGTNPKVADIAPVTPIIAYAWQIGVGITMITGVIVWYRRH